MPGRALRRQSYELYELNADGLFDVEYADILGIPFDFAAQPVVAPPKPPRETVRVFAVPERERLAIQFPRVEGYQVELPDTQLAAHFTPDSVLELSPALVGPSITRNQGIVGAGTDLTVAHLQELRRSTVLFHLTKHLLYRKYRDPGDEPRLPLFGQLKRIVRRWLDGGYLSCVGGTYPGQLLYQEIADLACERIKAAITESLAGSHPVRAMLDAYNPTGSTRYVNFTSSKALRHRTDPARCHVNWVICDSDWERAFARIAEAHPRVIAYAKNQGLGLEVPYLMGSEPRRYLPDFVLLIDDGQPDPLHLVAETKGYRGEDAKEKANAMRAYWVPGVNRLERYGRWAFAELTDGLHLAEEFGAIVAALVAAAPVS